MYPLDDAHFMHSLSLSPFSVCYILRFNYLTINKVPEFKPHSIRSCKHEMRIIVHKTYLFVYPCVNGLKTESIASKLYLLCEHPFAFFFTRMLYRNRVTETKYLIYCGPNIVENVRKWFCCFG